MHSKNLVRLLTVLLLSIISGVFFCTGAVSIGIIKYERVRHSHERQELRELIVNLQERVIAVTEEQQDAMDAKFEAEADLAALQDLSKKDREAATARERQLRQALNDKGAEIERLQFVLVDLEAKLDQLSQQLGSANDGVAMVQVLLREAQVQLELGTRAAAVCRGLFPEKNSTKRNTCIAGVRTKLDGLSEEVAKCSGDNPVVVETPGVVPPDNHLLWSDGKHGVLLMGCISAVVRDGAHP